MSRLLKESTKDEVTGVNGRHEMTLRGLERILESARSVGATDATPVRALQEGRELTIENFDLLLEPVGTDVAQQGPSQGEPSVLRLLLGPDRES
ncbi:MAG: hypothetical protein A2284_07600 [Deltaproteobacteria bacterium RIFOXYA12_FULL_61_11]|nr:MAG: hypothetical protein A2284_07600 [Deltaproteobacteria bacterium RIFOXYA12_FULL_61_11]